MSRSETIRIRSSVAEKETFWRAANEAGISLSEFARRAMKAVDPKKLRGEEPLFPRVSIHKPSRRKARSIEEIQPFKTPFLHGSEGAGFERAVRYTARMMRTDEATVAIALTYVAESIANALASGQLVRWPGLFVAGAYSAESKQDGREHVWPRFQACPPLSRYIDDACPPSLAKNHEMNAHRRRSRRKGVQSVAEVMATARQAIVNQDLRALRILEDCWRDESLAHVV